jgi:uncharacterized protein
LPVGEECGGRSKGSPVDADLYIQYWQVPTLRFEWDETKNGINLRKHGIDFATVAAIFDDPQQLLIPDHVVDGEQRWQTIGALDGVLLLLVVHTLEEEDDEEVLRLISARKVERHERRLYEDGL